MANELTITVSLEYLKGSRSISKSYSGVRLDVSGTDYVQMTQTIGITEEALDLGDITTPGYIIGKNLDTTNFLEIRPNTAVADMIKVPAGGVFCLPVAADAVPYAIADTAACELEYLLIEA